MDDENLTEDEREDVRDDGMSGEEAHRYEEYEAMQAHMRHEDEMLNRIDSKLDDLLERIGSLALTTGAAVVDVDGDGDADAVAIGEEEPYLALEDLDYTITNTPEED